MGSGFNFFTNAIDVTPTTTDAWVDVDVSAHIPAGSTGVIVDFHNTTAAKEEAGIRKNGSTDNRAATLTEKCHRYNLIGVDANRIFEVYIGSTGVKVWLVGYCDDAVTFETNGVDKSLTVIGVWTDVDISDIAPAGSTGVIVEIYMSVVDTRYGSVRKNGSTDDRTAYSYLAPFRLVCALCGLDANYIFEGKIERDTVDFYVIGYTKAPITFFTNAVDKSLTATGVWTDIDLTADTEAAADGAIFEIHNTDSLTNYIGELRKNGSTDDRTASANLRVLHRTYLGVGLDTDNICEGYINNTAVDFYLLGYCKPVVIPFAGGLNPQLAAKILLDL